MFQLVFSLFLFTFLAFPTLKAQEAPKAGTIYFVLGSDSSTPGINVRDKTAVYKSGGFDLFTSPDRNAAKIMNSSFRERFKDSDGKPFRFTWFMQGGSLYKYATNSNIPFPSLMSLYLMQKYNGEALTQLGDEFTYHYHTWVWSDVNGDGKYWWNQTDSFLDARADFFENLAEALIEEDMFPVSFRSGWHYMDNDWQADLNDWVPFSMHNAYPANAKDTVEPIDNLYTWNQAPSTFVPFKPQSENYQLAGGNKGWNTRSISFSGAREAVIRSIFEQAKNGIDQVPCIWSHVADNTFISDLERVFQIIETVAKDYPEVKFRYDTGVEAMQAWLKTNDKEKPQLTVTKIQQGIGFKVQVQSNEAIFQKTPFFAAKDRYEQHRVVEMSQISSLLWETNEVLTIDNAVKWSIAVSDSVGNQTKYHANELPDDIFLDDETAGFSTQSFAKWSSVNSKSLDLLWGRAAQTALLQVGDSVSAKWTTTISESVPRSIFVRFPSGLGISDSLNYLIFKNDELVQTPLIVNPKLNEWIFLADVEVFETDKLDVVLYKKAKKSNERLIADVVKITALKKPKWLLPNQATMQLNAKIIEKTYNFEITLQNKGFESAQINSISSKSSAFSIDENLPLLIAPFSEKVIPLALFATEYGLLKDTLVFETNDPNHAQIRIPLQTQIKDYFELIDNDDSKGYQEFGDWKTSSTQAYGASSRYVLIKPANKDAKAIYKTVLEQSGFYGISFLVPSAENSSLRARHLIKQNGQILDTVIVNQNTTSNYWRSLGIFEFKTNDEIAVEIDLPDVDQPNNVLRTDALQFERMGENLASIIFDNDDAVYSEKGTWNKSVAKAYGESSRFAPWGESEAYFDVNAPSTGVHQLQIIVPKTVNASENARYSIFINQQLVDEVILNQNTNSGNWVTVGSWFFNENNPIRVKLSNADPQNSSFVLRADAIKWIYGQNSTTAIESLELPKLFSLGQNYPNPFNPSTSIQFSIPRKGFVSLEVYSLIGQKVKTLVSKEMDAGNHLISFEITTWASGVYFYQLRFENEKATKTMILIK